MCKYVNDAWWKSALRKVLFVRNTPKIYGNFAKNYNFRFAEGVSICLSDLK